MSSQIALRLRLSPVFLIFFPASLGAHIVHPPSNVIVLFAADASRGSAADLRRFTVDFERQLQDLVSVFGRNLSAGEVRRRGLAVARSVVHYSNRLPEPAEGAWPKTKQVKDSASYLEDLIVSFAGRDAPTLEFIRRSLSETLVLAQVENRILSRFKGNRVDGRRTDRVLRALARRMALTCETALYRTASSKNQESTL